MIYRLVRMNYKLVKTLGWPSQRRRRVANRGQDRNVVTTKSCRPSFGGLGFLARRTVKEAGGRGIMRRMRMPSLPLSLSPLQRPLLPSCHPPHRSASLSLASRLTGCVVVLGLSLSLPSYLGFTWLPQDPAILSYTALHRYTYLAPLLHRDNCQSRCNMRDQGLNSIESQQNFQQNFQQSF